MPALISTRRSFLRKLPLLALVLGTSLLARASAEEVENPETVAGFIGTVTGKVKSAQADGRGFVLAIAKADSDASSTLKDGASLVGKELTIGVRMPKKPDGQSYPHADDVAYLKSLKSGMVITVKIFAPRSSPRVLRIQAPGAPATETPASPK